MSRRVANDGTGKVGVNLLFRVSVQSDLGLGMEKGCNRSIKSIVGNFGSLV
jgi:hypothetical protein